jgi:hypothetical protein
MVDNTSSAVCLTSSSAETSATAAPEPATKHADNKKPVKIMEQGNEVNIVVEQIRMPSFNEFCKMNESVETEMSLYSEIASRVDQLKEIYGDKAMAKTGIIKSLEAINRLILTAQKEKQPQESQGVQSQPQAQSQPFSQPQAQSQPFSQPQAQTDAQPQPQPQAQTDAQPQAQAQK